jgi:hypothetical protein
MARPRPEKKQVQARPASVTHAASDRRPDDRLHRRVGSRGTPIHHGRWQECSGAAPAGRQARRDRDPHLGSARESQRKARGWQTMTNAVRMAILIALLPAAGVGFAVGYFVGRGPGWVLWENRGATVHATTEFFSTQSGCQRTRAARSARTGAPCSTPTPLTVAASCAICGSSA